VIYFSDYFNFFIIEKQVRDMDRSQMEKIELLDESQIRNLLNISNFVNSNLDLDTILQTVVDSICGNTIWPIAGIVIVNEQEQEVWFAAERGFQVKQPIEEDRWALDVCLSPLSIKSGKTIVVDDFLNFDDLPRVREYCIENGYRSALVVPLLDVTPATVLWLCTPRVTQFSESDIMFAECLAHQVVIAFRNATLYEQSRSQAAELEKINFTVSQLLNTVVDSRFTAEKIRDTAAKLVENPIWFEDQFGNRLPDRTGPTTPDKFDQLLPVHYQWNERNAVAIPVVSAMEQFGWILTWESVRPFKDSDISFLRQLALVFSLIFLKERVHHEVESQIRTDLFSSLVSTFATNSNADTILKQRVGALNVALPKPGRVGVLDLQTGTSSIDLNYQDKLARSARAIAKWLPNRLVALQEQYIAILISPGEEKKISNRLGELLYYFPNASPILALGEIVHNTNEYGESLATALTVLKAAQYLRLKSPIVTSEELGIYYVLFNPKRQGDLEFYSRQILSELIANDPQGIYWETLEKFFENNCHLDATAKSLNIHISTLRYRLERIRNLFGVDWQHSDTRLQIHIAIVVEQWRRATGLR
jgi:sugar diacid utilization regulator